MANDHLAAVGFCHVLWQRNSSGEEKGYLFLWIVAFDNGLETSQSSLFHHPEWAMNTHHL